MSTRLYRAVWLALASTVVVACADAGDAPGKQSEDVVDVQRVPTLGARIDRIGRPEITNFVIRVKALKEEYNAEDSFAVPDEKRAKYLGAARAAITHYDAHDGFTDHDEASTAALAEILIDDHLRIDLSKACDVSSAGHFALELAELRYEEASSCGGRNLNEDVFDALLTIYTSGVYWFGEPVGDGVDLEDSTGVAGKEFPYLAAPHLTTIRP